MFSKYVRSADRFELDIKFLYALELRTVSDLFHIILDVMWLILYNPVCTTFCNKTDVC